jgi:hypothetical protein
MKPIRLIAIGLLSGTLLHTAHAFDLLSPEQAAAEQQALRTARDSPEAAPPRSRSSKPAPSIKVLSPPLNNGPLKSPLRIELRFEPLGDVKINPASFKVLYGMLRIDLTDKIRGNATLTEAGLLADKVSIPSGSHRLLLQVADMAGRVTETELQFSVD